MSTAATDNGQNEKPGTRFMRNVTDAAHKLLDDWVGPDRAAEAVGRVATALQSAVMAAKNPQDFYDCTPASVAQVVAVSALTGIMPGTGPAALAYAIPRKTRGVAQLNYSLSHRGIAALARRAGTVLVAVPVSLTDEIEMVDGEVSRFVPNIDDPPTSWEELRGVVLIVKDESGRTLFRGWVAKKVIAIRRESSDSYKFAERTEWARASDPWHAWPVEQSMKTAMHYGVSRGWAVVDDTESVRALSADARADVIDVEPDTVETTATPRRGGLNLPDYGEQPDPLAGVDPRQDQREKVVAGAQTIDAKAETKPLATGPSRADLAAECKALEGRLVSDLAAVDAARKAAGLDPESPVSGRWSEADLTAYLRELTKAEVAAVRARSGGSASASGAAASGGDDDESPV